MTESFAIILMMNNYLHDVATALLITTAYVTWVLWNRLSPDAGPDALRYFVRIYYRSVRLAWFSFFWIIVCGIPRVIYYKDFEWANMAGRGQVPALIVKHIVAFSLVAGGIALWSRVRKEVVAVEKKLGAEQ